MRPLLFIFLLLASAEARATYFNGFEIYHYLPAESWNAKDVLSMSEDRHGVTWLGTTEGLYELKNSGAARQMTPLPGFEHQRVSFVQEDPNGIIWICTREQGLILRHVNHHSKLEYEDYGFPKTFKNNPNINCSTAPNGDIYVLNCPFLYRFRWKSKQLTLEQKLDIADPGLVQQMSFCPTRNSLFIVCKKKNIFHLYTISQNGLTKLDWPLYQQNARNLARSFGQYEPNLLGHRNDSLLLSLNFDPMHQYSLFINYPQAYFFWGQQHSIQRLLPIWGVVKEYYQTMQQSADETALNLHKFLYSKQGYWCFATTQGLFVLKPQTQHAFKILRSSQGSNISAVVSDGNNQLWYSTFEGLFRHQLKTNLVTYNDHHKAVRSILPQHSDSLWLVYNGFEGLKMALGKEMNPQEFPLSQIYRHNFPSPGVRTPVGVWINSDSPKDLYCLHWPDARPIAHLNLKQNPAVNKANTDCAKAILWAKQDSSLWLGGPAGLFRIIDIMPDLHKAHQDTLTLPQRLKKLKVNSLYEDVRGNIWIGTENHGLLGYNPRQKKIIRWLKLQHGLPHSSIMSILGSHQDTLLWLGTLKGLSCFNTQTGLFTNFSPNSGLPSTTFNVMAACMGSNGLLYFGTTNGVLYFKPWMPAPRRYLGHPYVSISTQNIKGKKDWYKPTAFETIKFKANVSNVTFELFVSDISIDSRVLFRYSIRGLTTGWREQIGAERLFIPQLAPGNYQMQVQALLPNGSISQTFTFYFHKNAPWYNSTWFYTLLVLLLGGLVYLIHKIRIAQIEREYQLRKQVTADLHDNLSSRIYAMKVLSDRIANTHPEASILPVLSNRLKTLSLDTLQNIRTFIWAFDPKNNSLKALLYKIERFTLQTINPILATPVHLSFPISHLNTAINPQVLHHILMTIQELLTNMVKHTQSHQLSIRVEIKQKKLWLFIDNQSEKLPTVIHTIDENYGLEGIQLRLEKINGEISFIQQEHTQKVTLQVPIC